MFLLKMIKKSVSALTLAIGMTMIFGIIAFAAEDATPATCKVLVYNEQEGRGHLKLTYNGKEFKNVIEIPQGDSILAQLEVYEDNCLIGWYINGIRKPYYDGKKTVEIKAKGEKQLVVVVKSAWKEDYLHSHNGKSGVVTYNWSNKTLKFVNRAKENSLVAATTSMALQGDECMAVFETYAAGGEVAGTYNFTFDKCGKVCDTLPVADTFCFTIPEYLVEAGKTYSLIGVYKGQPTVYEDQDNDLSTITFSTDKGGAYALIVK